MRALESVARQLLFVPVAGVRTYLLLRGTLLLVAFDVWLTRISHGGRYGAGDFNVAHFAWLDALQPGVSPALYVGVSTLTGFLCFTLALAPRPPRWLLGVAFALHTWGWAMSMLDSYQHHYLLSIVLLALIFFPRLSAEEALLSPAPRSAETLPPKRLPARGGPRHKTKKGSRPDKTHEPEPTSLSPLRAPTTAAWAYVALAWSIAIVYAYTAFSKTSDEWLSGAAMQSVLRLPAGGEVPEGASDPVAPLRWLASICGIEGERFWWMLGHSVVLVQIVCAVGYLLAPFRDAARRRFHAAYSWIALATALSFHLGAEHMQLKIGWFSWYMIMYALIMLLPAAPLAMLMRALLPLAGRPLDSLLLARVGVGSFFLFRGLYIYVVGHDEIFAEEWAQRFADTFLDGAVIAALGVMILLVTPLRLLLHALSRDERKASAHTALISVALAAIALYLAGRLIDLPGAEAAGVIGACALGAGAIGLLIRHGHTRAIHPYGVGAALSAMVFFLVVWQSDVRFDFWRNVGGDHRRRNELVTAYEAYVKANCYAPPGEHRRQEGELREALQQRGQRLPEVECTLPREHDEARSRDR